MLRFLSLSLAAAIAALSFSQTKPTLIANVRVEVGDGRVIERTSILVQGGRIAAISPDLKAPSNGETFDASGQTVYPGFIDAYSTNGVTIPAAPAAATPPNATTTAPASMWAQNRKGIRSELSASKLLSLKDDLAGNYAQGVLAAHLACGGATLRGNSTVVVLRDAKPEEIVLVPTAAAEMAFRPGTGSGYPTSLMGIIALMRQTLLDAFRYRELSLLGTKVDPDPALEGLQPLANRTVPALFAADSQNEIVRATQMADEFGLRLMVALGRDAYEETARLKAKEVPVLLSLNFGSEPSRTSTDGTPAAVLEERYAEWEARAKGALKLHESGVVFAFASPATGISDYLKNVRRLVGWGLPRTAALQAMCVTPARVLGVSDRLGTVEAGKIANLVLMSGDFADEKATVQTVFVAGNRVAVAKKEAAQ